MYQYYNPVKIYEGVGCFQKIPQIMEEMETKVSDVLLIVWDNSVSEMEKVNNFINMKKYNVNVYVFDKSNPTVENLYKLYEETKEFTFDLIVGIGGGSVLDVSKILAMISRMKISSTDDLRRIIDEKLYRKPSCRWIGVPTTAGTGSEVTCWATIWDVEKWKKLSVERQDNYAFAAVVDSEFIRSFPLKAAVSSALDAIAHAIESYWAIKRNPVSQAHGLEAIRMIMSSVEQLCENSGKSEVYESMAIGSMLAGLAFSNTKTTACHSISYPLTMYYKIPHGVAASMLIGPMITMNKDALENPNLLTYVFGVENINEIERKLNDILTKAEIPVKLKDWGIEKDKIGFLAEHGATKGRIDNNPVTITRIDIEKILETIYE